MALLQADVGPAFNIALDYLSRSARSQQEMTKYLRMRQYAPQVIDAVLEKLKDYKFIDDVELSQRTVANLQQQTLGRAAIERKLRVRGVDKKLARMALLKYSAEDEDQNARRLAEQLWQRHQRDDLSKRRQKVAAALARRGFSWDVIHSAMQTLSNQGDEEGEF
jgi:regulatory protein